MKTAVHTPANRSASGYERLKIRPVWLEFRKLFMPKRVGLALLVLLLVGMWLYPFRAMYPGAAFKDWDTAVAVQMEADYGLRIDEAEFNRFKQSLAPKIAEADAYIRSTPAFARAGLDSYERYVKRDRMINGGTLPLNRIVEAGPAADLFAELQASRNWIEYYEMGTANTLGMNEAEKKRASEVESRDWVSVLPPNFVGMYSSWNLLNRLAVTAMLITAMLVMPIQIGDRRAGLGELQASSKAGITGLFRMKTAAALWAGTLAAGTLLVVLLLAYRFSGAWTLMGADINGKAGGLFWYDLSFLQYVLATYAAVFVLCWMTALLTVFFSSVAPNYVVLAGAVALTLILFYESDYLLNPLLNHMLGVGLGRSPLRTPIALGILLLASAALAYIAWKRETKRVRW
ncbi:hypothetical protein [Saccharibacillus alkalitolerans]|uniref:ABC transporter permease n=1 Tax=Saccharibacillus alkalitolerans TaxID=2705290 RepID=A0ABX0F0N7_9BACL|nr:hypothetical protein [Saccharibacillus alkalitolerans]NGZ74020.1 hypothetical protein [Saccharibacillus alkalitolerans]